MKTFILIILSLISVSCSSTTQKTAIIHPDFKPYIVNYLENHNSSSTPNLVTGKEMSIMYDDNNYAPTYAAFCQMSPKIQDRKIFINKKYWARAKVKNLQAEYINSVLGTCGVKGSNSRTHGDLYVRPLNYLVY